MFASFIKTINAVLIKRSVYNLFSKSTKRDYKSEVSNNAKNCITCTTQYDCNKIKYCLTQNIYYKRGYDDCGSITFGYAYVPFNKANHTMNELSNIHQYKQDLGYFYNKPKKIFND